jgi:hypothetical protein
MSGVAATRQSAIPEVFLDSHGRFYLVSVNCIARRRAAPAFTRSSLQAGLRGRRLRSRAQGAYILGLPR